MQTEPFLQLNSQKLSYKTKKLLLKVSSIIFTNLVQKKEEKQKKIEVFSVSIIDIKKALTSQKKTDLRTILFNHYHEFLDVFDHTMTEKLSFLREEGTDHQIELKEIDEKESKVF